MLHWRIPLLAALLLPSGCGDSAGGDAEPATSTTSGTPSANDDTTGPPADGTSSSSSGSGGSSSSGAASSSSGGSSSGEPVDTCFDDVVDPGELCFGEHTMYEMGRSVRDVFVSDYDLDGNLDIATLDVDEPAVYIRYGNGRRDFAGKLDGFDVTSGAFGMHAGDFDLDGDTDLVVFGSALTTLINNAGVLEPFSLPSPGIITGQLNDGITGEFDLLLGLDIAHTGEYSAFFQRGTLVGQTWEFGQQTLLPVFEGASGIASGVFGFDGDEYEDLVVVNQGRNSAQLLRSNGDGAFILEGEAVVCPPGSGAYRVQTGDLDADGNLDLVTTCDVGIWTITYGTGGGEFDDPLEQPVETVFQAAISDIDQDGDLDALVTQSLLGHIEIFINDGRAPFTFDTTLDAVGDAWSFEVTDIDRDGAVDVIAALTDGPVGNVAIFWANP